MEKQNVQQWVNNGLTPDAVRAAEEFGTSIKNSGLTTSQIRQVFTRLKSIEAKGYSANKVEFLMLKPFLAYAAGRHNKQGLTDFKEKITWGIDAVAESDEKIQEKRFGNFCKLFEAILAYHRAAGGK